MTSFPIPLKYKNQAMLTLGSLPIDRDDLERIKKWIDLFGSHLTEPIEDSPERTEDPCGQ